MSRVSLLKENIKQELKVNTRHQHAWCAGAKAITRVIARQRYIVFTHAHHTSISIVTSIPLVQSLLIMYKLCRKMPK